MEVPKGRYSVVEKDGRLIVIDNGTGAPATPVMPTPRPGRPGVTGVPGPSPAPIVEGKNALDGAADFLLGLAVREWDADGNAIIAWEWKENGKPKRWDAVLDPAQQRRLGRALLSFTPAPLFFLAFALLSGPFMWIALALTMVPIIRGLHGLKRLRSETIR